MTNGTNAEWWQTFFFGPWQDLQLAGYPDEQTQAEAAFIISELRLEPGARFNDEQNLRFASRVMDAHLYLSGIV